MNKTNAAVVFGLALSLICTECAADTLTCLRRGGSDQTSTVTLYAKNQRPGWAELRLGLYSTTLRLGSDSSPSGGIGTGLWPVYDSVLTVKYYNPGNGTYWTATDRGEISSYMWKINAHLENGDTKKEYPPVSVTLNFKIKPALKGDSFHLIWKGANGNYEPNADVLDVTASHSTTHPHSWEYEPVVDMGDHNHLGAAVSHMFSQNPEPNESKLTLAFKMERGQTGSNSFRVNGRTGNAGSQLVADGNTGPTLLEVIPSGVEGPFKGTVTATLTCL